MTYSELDHGLDECEPCLICSEQVQEAGAMLCDNCDPEKQYDKDHLVCRTETGIYVASQAECLEQFHNWDPADNIAGWLYRSFIHRGLDLAGSRAMAESLLLHGSNETVDVRTGL